MMIGQLGWEKIDLTRVLKHLAAMPARWLMDSVYDVGGPIIGESDVEENCLNLLPRIARKTHRRLQFERVVYCSVMVLSEYIIL